GGHLGEVRGRGQRVPPRQPWARRRRQVAVDVEEARRGNAPGRVRIDASLVFQIPTDVGDDDVRIAEPCFEPRRRDERGGRHGYWMRTALLYIAIPHWNVSVRASVVGISTLTGVFSGRSLSILSSGKTTSLAQVSSVVRTKKSWAGLPFSSLTSLGKNPFLSTTTFACWTPAGAGGMAGSAWFCASPDLEHPAA